MNQAGKNRLIAAFLFVGAVVWVALAAYTRWSVYLAPQSFDALAPQIWLAGAIIVATFIFSALKRGRRFGSAGVVKSSFIIVLAVFLFGMGFMFATYGVAALGAKLALGQPTNRCYGVVHYPASRGMRLDLRDLESGYIHKLKYPGYLVDTSIDPASDYARVIGKQSWFGINVEAIQADPECMRDADQSGG